MRLLFLVALASCLASAVLPAQDAPLPKAETQDPGPERSASATPAPTPELIPADILPPPDPATPLPMPDIPTIEQLDQGLKPPPLSPAEQAHRLHLEWRKLRNRAQNDPQVKAALAEADAAKTDLQRRKLLARYFEIFHARQIALAPPEMKQYLLDRKREHLASLPQPRVRPETALPTPTPAPTTPGAVTPTPSPSGTPPTSKKAYASPTPSPFGALPAPRLPRP